jgi:phage terminase large subunit GpA-like protein
MEFCSPDQVIKRAFANWKTPPRLTIREWADSYRQLSSEASAEPGQWRTSKVPYAAEIMETITYSEKVVFMASSQVAKTEILLNCVGYFMHLDPCPMMLLEPTIEMAETVSKDRVAPMLRDTPVLSELVGQKRSKDSENTILHKTFRGGHLTLTGANSSASLASRPIRNLWIDECDRFPFSAGAEGDPIKLATKRTTTFWNRRIVVVSTPTIKGASRIEIEYELSDKRKYFVPCPHCGEYQILSWSQFRWKAIKLDGRQEVERAWYECEHCQGEITEGDKPNLLAQGKWRPTAKAKTPGFHIWQAYSPWSTFEEIVQDFLDSKDNPELLKVWTNTCLGESFDEQGGEGLAWQNLLARCEPYEPLTVPRPSFLTAGVDVQKDRLVISVWAWGRGEEGWLVYHQEIYGNPLEGDVWSQLDAVVGSSFTHPESKKEVTITATAIDTGYLPQEVYNYVRMRKGLFAVKGSNLLDKPVINRPTTVEVNHKGKTIRNGVKLWTIGVGTIKSLVYNRLRLTLHGAGYLHFFIGLEAEYFEQLTAEKLTTKFLRGFPKQEWIKTRARNEALDCVVYAYAAALLAGLPRTNWNKLEAEFTPHEPEPTPHPPEKPPKQKTWVPKQKKWMG